MFNLTNLINIPLSHSIREKYKNEVELFAKMITPVSSLGTYYNISETAAKTAKKGLDIFKSFENIEKGLKSINFLLISEKLKTADITIIVINISSAILLPFAVIDLVEKAKSLDFVHAIFKNAPVLGSLKFAGIPRITIIVLLSSAFLRSCYKEQKLSQKKEALRNSTDLAKIERNALKITLNRCDISEKTVKIAFSVLSLAIDIFSFTHPYLRVIKISCLAIEILCNSRVYLCKERLSKAA